MVIYRPFKVSVSYNRCAFLLALFFTLFLNWHFFLSVEHVLYDLPSVKVGFAISIPLFLLLILNFLFQLFAWPWLTKPFFIILLLCSGMVSYAGLKYGIIFDEAMLVNVLETNSAEAQTYLNVNSVLGCVGLSIVPALLVWKIALKPISSWPRFLLQKAGYLVVSLLGIGGIAGLYYQDYASVGRNNTYLRELIVPTYFVKTSYDYVKDTYFTVKEPFKPIGLDAHIDKSVGDGSHRPTLVVFMLGETSRAQNYEYYGYPRDTNPYTKPFSPYVFKAVSCGTSTAISVPCLFSRLNRTEFSREKARNQDSAVDVLQRAGVKVYWLDNDSGSKGVADRVPNHTLRPQDNPKQCLDKTCYDEALLEGLNVIPQTPNGDRLIVLHLMGSHGPTYYQRYPERMRFFKPDCPRSDIENCTKEELVNTFDNTIRYVDYVNSLVLGKLRTLQQQYNVVFWYVSDHGESLGENGIYLHGMPYALAPNEQIHVPFLMWFSKGFLADHQLDKNCLTKATLVDGYSHDNVFDTMLGLFGVTTQSYRPQQDILNGCR